MAKSAIVKIGPFQYNLEEGKQYSLPKFKTEVGKTETISDVLAITDGDKVETGNPVIKGATVNLSILEIVKGEKVKTMVYKAKSRYRKQKGFRKQEVKVKVDSINIK